MRKGRGAKGFDKGKHHVRGGWGLFETSFQKGEGCREYV